MISRLSAIAATVAVLATASLAYAANLQGAGFDGIAAKPVQVIHLQTVTIVGKRDPNAR